ncbi:MAG TPA: MASE1 domain-containing protein [Gaiellaceae bacterium]|nr:MASE1 domain-containing protein [Gaiellaceae bacterium]
MGEYSVATEHAAREWYSVLRVPRRRTLLATAALVGAYYASARIGYELEFSGPVAAIVWLPVGVGIAFLYVGGMGLWPGVVLGDLLANQYSALPIGSALGQTVGNTLEVVVGALLIRRLSRRGDPLGSVTGVVLLVLAIAAATALSATVGNLSLLIGNVIQAHELPTVWRTWWLGDACGALIIVPLAIAWSRGPFLPATRQRTVEAALGLVVAAALTELGFHSTAAVAYLAFPGLLWAALRFGQRGATLAVAVVAGIAVWETVHDNGPFIYQSVTRSLLSTQLFIFVAALSTLCLAAVVSERRLTAQRLRASRARLLVASDSERRRLERNLHDGAQQRLTALAFRLQQASDAVPASAPEARALLGAASTELDLAIEELRELAHGIHPAAVSTYGLAAAVNDIALRSPIPVDRTRVTSERLSDDTEATAYYVIAEAVTNAQRHAHASGIEIGARVVDGSLRVDVQDDGVGGARQSGSGLQGLRDRVEAAGGTFRVESPRNGGTLVAAAIPVPAER